MPCACERRCVSAKKYSTWVLIAIPYSYVALASYVDTDIHGTLNVVEAARDLSVKRVVLSILPPLKPMAQPSLC